jgi:GNAT superfamily N-acetyltransferase
LSHLEIRRATSEDVVGILDTLTLALGESSILRRTPDLWRWKHEMNPFGESIVFVAVEGDSVAAVRAFMRWNLIAEGSVVRCVRAVDTATHPRYRRQGLFRRLTNLAVEAAIADGVDLIFNTPNEKSGPGYLNMGWKRVGDIGVQVRPVLGSTVAPDEHRPPTIAESAPGFGPIENMPVLFQRPPTRSLHTPLSAEYLKWRFQLHPTASYGWLADSSEGGLVARASIRSGRAELIVSDLLGDTRSSVIGKAAKAAHTRYLAGWFSPGSERRRLAIRGGLYPVPGFKTLQLVSRRLADLPVDPSRLASWDIGTSDLELL